MTTRKAPVLHHIGHVVRSIEVAKDEFADIIGEFSLSETTYDPAQAVNVAFLTPLQGGAVIELVEPAGTASPVASFLRKGGGIHHVCYEVDDLAEQLSIIRKAGAIVVRPPTPAAAFGGRKIAWIVTKSRLLVEYLQTT